MVKSQGKKWGRNIVRKGRGKSKRTLTKFWDCASTIPPLICPLLPSTGGTWPNNVGPKTIPRFVIVMEFRSELEVILRGCLIHEQMILVVEYNPPVQMPHQVLQRRIVSIRKLVHALVHTYLTQSLVFSFYINQHISFRARRSRRNVHDTH